MALGTAVHDTECNPDNNKNVTVDDSDNKKITEDQEKNAGRY